MWLREFIIANTLGHKMIYSAGSLLFSLAVNSFDSGESLPILSINLTRLGHCPPSILDPPPWLERGTKNGNMLEQRAEESRNIDFIEILA